MYGTTETIAANVITEHLLLQVDQEGHQQLLLDEIMDHQCLDLAIPKSAGIFTTTCGVVWKKCTMRGWELCVQWKDGSTNWFALKDVKNLFPIELADYAIANGIYEEPAFS